MKEACLELACQQYPEQKPDPVKDVKWTASPVVPLPHVIKALEYVMLNKDVDKSGLAARMGITRQAVYDKFYGRNMSVKWLQRACDALGVELWVNVVDPEDEE